MKITTLTFAAAVSFALTSPWALAATDETKAGEDTMMEDQGMTSLHSPQFEELDADGNGLISAEELNVYGSTAAGQAAEAAGESITLEVSDANEDGSIDRDEFEQSVMPME
ncbi:hypothetical protein [Marinobacter sp. SS21]|uniref:hypothetical protein n=1 Tax=Marinobacter sp. SS21 TaxID=2979460 RepID=UPI00232BA9C8|nr:hypothetical protein [Marinobacter sp. SS21]MDC0661605.1 hypothetical protein [Marinobacter sp. SS21]